MGGHQSLGRVRVIADTNGAGIASLVERGRNVDHFSSPKDLIQRRFELSGHTDQLVFGWGDNRLADTSMSSSGARERGETTKLSFAERSIRAKVSGLRFLHTARLHTASVGKGSEAISVHVGW